MIRIIEFMKRNYIAILFSIILGAALWSFMPSQKNTPNPNKEAELIELLMFVLENGHYAPIELNDSISQDIYKNFIEIVDPNKRFFLQSDIDDFKMYETLIDNELYRRRFDFFDLVYERSQQRAKEVEEIYQEVLSKPFDYTIDEEIETDSEKIGYAKNKEELKERWRQQMKFSVLVSIVNKKKVQDKKDNKEEDIDEVEAEEIELTDNKKKDDTPKTFKELEEESRETSRKSLENFFEMFNEMTREEWFAVYVNTILEQYDPHTNYFSPDNKKRFDESMSGSMEGIGAQLRKKDDYVEISQIIPGGPAWKQNLLENGDLILKVAQDGEEPKDIGGMRLDNVVKMIKGKKGTVVHLTVKKIDETIEVISIERDKFELEDTYARSTVIETSNGKYGLIYLPKFYEDFENRDSKDAYIDVAREIEQLKKEGVQGIIMDLRNNGGGSLRAVVQMVGLFIPSGPVVQVRSSKGKTEVLNDRSASTEWDGPLVVMINNYSASASEIFAAAIQDYKRGVVVGSKHSFGKGTVQNMFDLNRLLKQKGEDYGALKFTTQKFYRINGGSTQLKGVESDVVFPDQYKYIDTGEKDYTNAMKWDKINRADYKEYPNDFKKIIEKSRSRIEQSAIFRLVDENARWIGDKKDKSVYSVNFNAYKAYVDSVDLKIKKYKELKEYRNSLKFKSLKEELALFAQDTVLKNKRERWHKDMNKDLYLEETVHILEDMNNR